MSPTLLFDLDNTLLENSMDTFLPAYFQAWQEFISPSVEPNLFIQAMLAATKKMIGNRRPDCTLKEIFLETFLPAIQMPEQRFEQIADQFYRQEFPKLRAHTRPIPGAVELLENALASGFQIALATAPLFPLDAILQRLDWAGVSARRFPFLVIPSFETFHFAKPNPAFFGELLCYLGWPEDQVVMVGDDAERDITPAQAAGLSTYWVYSNGRPPKGNEPADTAHGDLNLLLNWFDTQAVDALKLNTKSPSATLAALQATPAALDNLCRNLSDAGWMNQPSTGEWSPLEIVCHLRDVDLEVNLPRLERVLSEENPFIASVNTDQWIEERSYTSQNGPLALHQYFIARTRLLDKLDKITPTDWKRLSRHSIFGNTDLRELVNIISMHDRQHIRQILQDIHPNPLQNIYN